MAAKKAKATDPVAALESQLAQLTDQLTKARAAKNKRDRKSVV